ncbi:MAG TPA: hypothetical protein VNT51_00980 [Miltoncostaeaceae bacterium]|nr:hypothetical protein [Miltoncostaeaceae bacterium]
MPAPRQFAAGLAIGAGLVALCYPVSDAIAIGAPPKLPRAPHEVTRVEGVREYGQLTLALALRRTVPRDLCRTTQLALRVYSPARPRRPLDMVRVIVTYCARTPFVVEVGIEPLARVPRRGPLLVCARTEDGRYERNGHTCGLVA